MKTKLCCTILVLLSLSFGSIAEAESIAVTYQGRVTTGGADFTGTGQFKFALVTSTNHSHTATATANLTGTFVTSIPVTDGGSGYVVAPAVTITGGGGSGATATASISGGAVSGILVNTTGTGYTSPPTVTLSAPPDNIAYTTYWSNDGTGVAGAEPAAYVSVSVSNGLFTVPLGDTGLANMAALEDALFAQPDLKLAIWFNDGTHGFASLDPVQSLTVAPYAAWAGTASNVSGTISAAQVSGTLASANLAGTYGSAVDFTNAASSFAGNGANLSNVNATALGGLAASNFWKLGGNAGASPASGAFLGTSDNQPLELKVNGGRALRLLPTAGTPNVVGGFGSNFIGAGVVGAVVAGGGFANNSNRVTGSYSTVGGGYNNLATFGSATIAGGDNNVTGNDRATVGGGYNNRAMGLLSTVAGGDNNTASNSYSTVPGGSFNFAGASYSFAAGRNAKATNQGAFVWADSQAADFPSTANNQFLIRAQGGVGINANSPRGALEVATGAGSVIFRNEGGLAPGITVSNAVSAGVLRLRSHLEVWPNDLGNDPGSLDVRDTNGAATVRFSGRGDAYINTGNVGIGTATPQDARLDLEGNLRMNDNDIFLRGGANRNYGMGFRASVGSQSVDGPFAYGFYGGALGVGNPDTISLRWDWTGNVWVSNLLSTASFEVRSGALVVDAPGSNTNGVLGQGIVFGSSSGEGIVSKRATDGASGWGLDFFTAFQRRLTIQNGGNVGIGTNIPQQKLHVVGNILATGTITPNSDRNAKTDFASVDAAAVLEKVALLPIQQWRFKAEPDGVRHVGPMAQDFRAAFGLGEIPTAIATVDADGVALAAIQGLNEKVEGRMQNAEVRSRRLEEKLEQKETEIAELKTTVNELQQLMQAMNQKLNGGTR